MKDEHRDQLQFSASLMSRTGKGCSHVSCIGKLGIERIQGAVRAFARLGVDNGTGHSAIER